MKVQEYLPFFYKEFFEKKFFEKNLQPEMAADCANCVMCKLKGETEEDFGKNYFHPDVKCCTYYPNLPNYLVGAILADESTYMEEGRKRILDKITAKISVSPSGILTPDKYKLIYKNSTAFGKALDLACPYLYNGKCSIWKYRNSVCNTWFCSSDNGIDGQLFWEALYRFLNLVETKIVKYILFTRNISASQVDDQFLVNEFRYFENKQIEVNIADKLLNEVEYEKIWGQYLGKEVQFYIDCFNIAKEMNKKQFNTIVGIEGKALLKELKDKYSEMISQKPPNYLQRNCNIKFISIANEIVKLDLNNVMFNIPLSLYENLIWFDGKNSNKKALKNIEKQGVRLDKELVLYLYKHRILVKI